MESDNTEVPLDTLEETKDLSEIYDNGFNMAIPLMFNKSARFKNRGKSIFDGKIDCFDSYDESWSQWIDALRDNRTKTYIPEGLIPRDSDGNLITPNSYDRRFLKLETSNKEDANEKVDVVNPEMQHEGLLSTYITALDQCLQGIISPSTLGIDVKKLDNAESQREKEKATLYTRNRIVRKLEKTLAKLAEITMMTYDLAQEQTPGDYEASADFAEYANPSWEANVETTGKGKQYGIMSIEKVVDSLYGDSLTKEEKEEEVKRLKEEQGIIDKEEPSLVNEL